MPYCRARVLARKRFVHNLAIMVVWGYFFVGVYKYESAGSLSDWIVVFKVTCGASYKSQSVIDFIAAASQQTETLLSRQENSDYISFVRFQTGVNKNLATGII